MFGTHLDNTPFILSVLIDKINSNFLQTKLSSIILKILNETNSSAISITLMWPMCPRLVIVDKFYWVKFIQILDLIYIHLGWIINLEFLPDISNQACPNLTCSFTLPSISSQSLISPSLFLGSCISVTCWLLRMHFSFWPGPLVSMHASGSQDSFTRLWRSTDDSQILQFTALTGLSVNKNAVEDYNWIFNYCIP